MPETTNPIGDSSSDSEVPVGLKPVGSVVPFITVTSSSRPRIPKCRTAQQHPSHRFPIYPVAK